MTVSEGLGNSRDKEVKSRYPVVEGLVLGMTKVSGREYYLKPKTKSLISCKDKLGL